VQKELVLVGNDVNMVDRVMMLQAVGVSARPANKLDSGELDEIM
jgi:hypothetical protein